MRSASNLLNPLEVRDREVRKKGSVGFAILAVFRGDQPGPMIQVDVLPSGRQKFSGPTAG
ncbi:hypothetical protein D9M69_241330 [compost metagenome]